MGKHKPRCLAGLVLLAAVVLLVSLALRLLLQAPGEGAPVARSSITRTRNAFEYQCSDDVIGEKEALRITARESESRNGNKTARLEVYVAQWRNGSITLEQAVNYLSDASCREQQPKR